MPDKPRFPIRRFDVFAEYNRVQNRSHGMPEEQAKGRGIWAAKVVAGRGYGAPSGSSAAKHANEGKDKEDKRADDDAPFRYIGGVLQTDATFDKEIIDRMGKPFYEEVFRPAIEDAFADGKRYEDIRDAIRKEWK